MQYCVPIGNGRQDSYIDAVFTAFKYAISWISFFKLQLQIEGDHFNLVEFDNAEAIDLTRDYFFWASDVVAEAWLTLNPEYTETSMAASKLFFRLYELTHQQLDKKAIIKSLREHGAGAEVPNRCYWYANLGHASRYESPDETSLLAAKSLYQAALEHCTIDSKERTHVNYFISVTLRAIFEQTGTLEILRESIKICEKILSTVVEDKMRLAVYSHSISVSLRRRFEITSSGEDLQLAIQYGNSAFSMVSRETEKSDPPASAMVDPKHHDAVAGFVHPDFSSYANNLCYAYREWRRNPADLDIAVQYGKLSIKDSKASSTFPYYASGFSMALWRRYDEKGAKIDLDDDIHKWQYNA